MPKESDSGRRFRKHACPRHGLIRQQKIASWSFPPSHRGDDARLSIWNEGKPSVTGNSVSRHHLVLEGCARNRWSQELGCRGQFNLAQCPQRSWEKPSTLSRKAKGCHTILPKTNKQTDKKQTLLGRRLVILGFGGPSWPCGATFPLLIDGWSKSAANQDESPMTLKSTVMIHSYIISSKLAELSPSPHSLQQHQMCLLRVQAALVRHQWSSLSKRRQTDTWTLELHRVVMLCFISQGCKNRLTW